MIIWILLLLGRLEKKKRGKERREWWIRPESYQAVKNKRQIKSATKFEETIHKLFLWNKQKKKDLQT